MKRSTSENSQSNKKIPVKRSWLRYIPPGETIDLTALQIAPNHGAHSLPSTRSSSAKSSPRNELNPEPVFGLTEPKAQPKRNKTIIELQTSKRSTTFNKTKLQSYNQEKQEKLETDLRITTSKGNMSARTLEKSNSVSSFKSRERYSRPSSAPPFRSKIVTHSVGYWLRKSPLLKEEEAKKMEPSFLIIQSNREKETSDDMREKPEENYRYACYLGNVSRKGIINGLLKEQSILTEAARRSGNKKQEASGLRLENI
jgi:hypothetical protein